MAELCKEGAVCEKGLGQLAVSCAQLTEKYFVGSRITEKDVAALAGAGVKSVLNLLSDADGVLYDEETAVKNNGMQYSHVSISSVASIDIPVLNRLTGVLNELPKPVMVHCLHGRCASLVVLLRMGVETGASSLDVLRLGNQLGFNFASNANAYSLINKYISAAAPKPSPTATETAPSVGSSKTAATKTSATAQATSSSADSAAAADSVVDTAQPTAAVVDTVEQADRQAEAAVLGRLVGSCVALNNSYGVAGCITTEDIAALAAPSEGGGGGDEGKGKAQSFRSILNLMCPTEPGYNGLEESTAATTAGMQYEEVPVASVGAIDFHKAQQVQEVLTRMEKPVLVHAGRGARRAVLLVLLQIAVETVEEEEEEDVSVGQVLSLAAKLGMSFHNNFGIKTFLEEFLGAVKAGRECGSEGQRLVVGHDRLLRL